MDMVVESLRPQLEVTQEDIENHYMGFTIIVISRHTDSRGLTL